MNTSTSVAMRATTRVPVSGPLVGNLVVDGSESRIECRPFEVSNGGLGIWTKTPLTPGTSVFLRSYSSQQGAIRLKVRYCLQNHLNTDLFRCGLEAVDSQLDFFGARDGLTIVAGCSAIPSQPESNPDWAGQVRRSDAAIHDALNYLMVIRCISQLLGKPRSGEAPSQFQVDMARRLDNGVKQIEHCLEDIREERDNLDSEAWNSVSVSDLVHQAVDLSRGLMEQSGIEVTVEAISPHLRLVGKPKALMRVLINLLVNAKEAASKVSDRWIRVSAAQSNDRLVIKVADSGQLLEAHRAKIFAARYTTKAKNPSRVSGIGLTFARTVIEHHGGSLVLGEEEGPTTFVISLPVAAKEPT